jgi:hypothetical protein
MTDLSTIKEEQIVISKDLKTAIRYKVVAETIDLEALKREKEDLEAQLAEKEPSEKELIELGKSFHQFYMMDRTQAEKRILEITKLIGE